MTESPSTTYLAVVEHNRSNVLRHATPLAKGSRVALPTVCGIEPALFRLVDPPTWPSDGPMCPECVEATRDE